MLRNVKHEATPPDAVCLLELGSALISGDLDSWSHREWGKRWGCSRNKVKRIASMLFEDYSGTDYEPELLAAFPHLDAPPKDNTRTGKGQKRPTTTEQDQGVSERDAPPPPANARRKDQRAPDPLTDLDQDLEVQHSGDLFNPAPAPAPAPSPLDTVAEAWEALWAERVALGKHAAGGAPRGGRFGKGARAQIAKALKTQTAADLVLVARWAFQSDEFHAKAALRGEEAGKVLNSYLTPESVYRPTKFASKRRLAAMWQERGAPLDRHLGKPAPKPGQWQTGQWAKTSAPERKVINPDGHEPHDAVEAEIFHF